MSHDQFTTLFNYVEDFRSEMNRRFDTAISQESLDRLTNSVDAFIKRLDEHDTGTAVRDAQFERLLRAWP